VRPGSPARCPLVVRVLDRRGVDELAERSAQHLLRLPAQQVAHPVRHEHVAPGAVGRPDEVGRRLDHRPVALLGLAQLPLEALPLADVTGGAVDAGKAIVRVRDAHRVDLDRDGGPVLALELEAQDLGLAGLVNRAGPAFDGDRDGFLGHDLDDGPAR